MHQQIYHLCLKKPKQPTNPKATTLVIVVKPKILMTFLSMCLIMEETIWQILFIQVLQISLWLHRQHWALTGPSANFLEGWQCLCSS